MAVSACLCVVHGLQALCQLLICFAYKQQTCQAASALHHCAGLISEQAVYEGSPGVTPMVGYLSTGFTGWGVGVCELEASAEQPALSGFILISMKDQVTDALRSLACAQPILLEPRPGIP